MKPGLTEQRPNPWLLATAHGLHAFYRRHWGIALAFGAATIPLFFMMRRTFKSMLPPLENGNLMAIMPPVVFYLMTALATWPVFKKRLVHERLKAQHRPTKASSLNIAQLYDDAIAAESKRVGLRWIVLGQLAVLVPPALIVIILELRSLSS